MLLVLILWGSANCYLAIHFSPVIDDPLPEYIEECLEVVLIDNEYYLHQTGFFAQGEIVLLVCENGEVNFYLGENGIKSLGFARSWTVNPKYQRLIDPAFMSEVTTVNYCQPDGTVITTLWDSKDSICTLHKEQ